MKFLMINQLLLVNLKIKKITLLFFLTFFLQLLAIEIRLKSPERVYLKKNRICVDLETTDNILSDEIIEYLTYGIPVYFNYFIYFYEKKSFFDKILVKVVIRKKVEYDIWSKTYFIRCKKIKGYPKKIKNIHDLQQEVVALKGVSVIDQSVLSRKSKYYFKTKMGLIIKRSFSPFYQIFFSFFSVFKYKTTFFDSIPYSFNELKNFSKNKVNLNKK